MKIFGSLPGTVVALDAPDGAQAVLRVDGLSSRETVLITGFGTNMSSNFQVQPALRDVVYLYTFGDRPGQAEISGLAVWRTCAGASSGSTIVMQFYKSHRLSAANNSVRIAFGSAPPTVVHGHLHDLTIESHNPEAGYAQFKMNFLLAPGFE